MRHLKHKLPVFDRPQDAIKGRVCGECQACCYAMGIAGVPEDNPQVISPVFTLCAHQCAAGCGIQNQKPFECREYACLWLDGIMRAGEARPDKLGILFNIVSNQTVSAREVRPNARLEPPAAAVLRGLGQVCKVSLRLHPDSDPPAHGGDLVMYAPAEWVRNLYRRSGGEAIEVEEDGRHTGRIFKAKDVIAV